MVAIVIMVATAMVVVVNMVVMVDGTGQHRTKLTFKLDFPGSLWLAAFAILVMCSKILVLWAQKLVNQWKRGIAKSTSNPSFFQSHNTLFTFPSGLSFLLLYKVTNDIFFFWRNTHIVKCYDWQLLNQIQGVKTWWMEEFLQIKSIRLFHMKMGQEPHLKRRTFSGWQKVWGVIAWVVDVLLISGSRHHKRF